MKIEFNKVTWYSKLLALVLFLVVIPWLAFYIGEQYQIVKSQNFISDTDHARQNTDIKINLINSVFPDKKITSDDNGKVVTLAKSQHVEIVLGNPGDGGYQFDAPEYDTSLLHLNTHSHIAPTSKNALPGNFGTDVWEFTAIKSGSTDVSITATRPWKGGDTVSVFKSSFLIK